MSVNTHFRATVGRWPEDRTDEVFAALTAWVRVDEGFGQDKVLIDILGGGPQGPTVRMEAYTLAPVNVGGVDRWGPLAEERLKKRITAAGGEDVRLALSSPDRR